MGTRREFCKYGHVMEETRRLDSNGGGYCGVCAKENQERIRKANPEGAAARTRKYKKAHPEKILASNEEWKRKNPKRYRVYKRGAQVKHKYGLIKEEYDRMMRECGGVCEICGGSSPNGRELHVDHCHKTGKIRGLLCSHCNLGLGLMKDDEVLLRRAIVYLAREGIEPAKKKVSDLFHKGVTSATVS